MAKQQHTHTHKTHECLFIASCCGASEITNSLHSIFITSPSKELDPGAIDFHKIMSMKGSVSLGIPNPEETLSEYYFDNDWHILNTTPQSLSDNLIFTKDKKEGQGVEFFKSFIFCCFLLRILKRRKKSIISIKLRRNM